MYIAAELVGEMFFRKIGRVVRAEGRKCIGKHIESRISKNFN